MTHNVSPEVLAIIRRMQQSELDESVIYKNIAAFAKGKENRKTLLRLAKEELAECKNAIRQLGLKLEKVHEFPMDGTNHMVIVLRKVAPTPAKYPRRYAKIKAAPL